MRPSYSSIILTLFACANCHHASKPLGGLRPYRRLYSLTAARRERLWRESSARKRCSASSMRWGIGCPATFPVSRVCLESWSGTVVEGSAGTLLADKFPAKRPACRKRKTRAMRKRKDLDLFPFHGVSAGCCCDMGHGVLGSRLERWRM